MALLDRMGDDELAVSLAGDGAGSTVQAWAARQPDGRVDVLVWNSTLDQTKMDGHPALDRAVTLRVGGLPATGHTLRHHRVDAEHSNVWSAWDDLGGRGRDWPGDDEWERLRAANRLEELAPPLRVEPDGGMVDITFELPMPGISHLELSPHSSCDTGPG